MSGRATCSPRTINGKTLNYFVTIIKTDFFFIVTLLQARILFIDLHNTSQHTCCWVCGQTPMTVMEVEAQLRAQSLGPSPAGSIGAEGGLRHHPSPPPQSLPQVSTLSLGHSCNLCLLCTRMLNIPVALAMFMLILLPSNFPVCA